MAERKGPFNPDFVENRLKGLIAQDIFQTMMSETGKFIVVPFGHEHWAPELSQYPYTNRPLQDNLVRGIRERPDFILISPEHGAILVEVKYRSELNAALMNQVFDVRKKFPCTYIFVATPTGFFFDHCKNIDVINGKIKIAPFQEWTFSTTELEEKYIEILNKLIPPDSSILPQQIDQNYATRMRDLRDQILLREQQLLYAVGPS